MGIDLGFRLTFLLLFAGGLGASVVLRRRADRAGGTVPRSADERSVAIALRIGGGLFYGSVLAWLGYPPLVGWAGVAIPASGRWTGAVLLAAGIATGLWSLRHLGRNVTPTAVPRSDAELVTSGPYRWVRHPLYSSMMLTVPGCALLSANLLVLVGGVTTFVVILVRARREEAELVSKFRERYVAYMDRTGRVLPRLRQRR